MSSEDERDWQLMREEWGRGAQEVELTALRGLVATQRRRLFWSSFGEASVGLMFVALTIFVVRNGVESWELIWIASLWIFFFVAIFFVHWNRRGLWRVADESTEAYVKSSRLSCEREKIAVYFGISLFAAEVIAVIAQIIWFDRALLFGVAALAVFGVLLGAWAHHTLRRVKRELAQIDALRDPSDRSGRQRED